MPAMSHRASKRNENEIVAIDQQIKSLIEQRASLVTSESGRSMDLDPGSLTLLMKQISGACDGLISKSSVAFLGPTFSYSHLAATKYFGPTANYDAVTSIPAVFDAVKRDAGATGVVPIENSTDGRIVDTLGRLIDGDVGIVGEVSLAIHHNLLSKTPRAEVTEVHSKPQALSQCRRWLADHLPSAKLIETNSTGTAAKLASEQHGVAAVASIEAGQQYELDVLARSIEDNQNNVTRFAVLGHQQPPPTDDDKTSLICQVHHQPGALADLMMTFKTNGLNMTWIESFPIPGKPNEYFFFLEFDGHQDDTGVRVALDQLQIQSLHLHVLGSYGKCAPAS